MSGTAKRRRSRWTEAYQEALDFMGGGTCPLEAGVIGRLADNECRHGRLPFDSTAPCGCFQVEVAQDGLRRAA